MMKNTISKFKSSFILRLNDKCSPTVNRSVYDILLDQPKLSTNHKIYSK